MIAATRFRAMFWFPSILFSVLFGFQKNVFSQDLSGYEQTCSEVGFKRKTEAFGECVLELRRRDLTAKKQATEPSAIVSESKRPPVTGDGTPDDQTCRKFGMTPGSEPYGQCRLQLKVAAENAQRQQELYEQQQRAYEQQVAEHEEGKRRREKEKALKQLELGLRLMAGQAPLDAVLATDGKLPIAPQRPAIETYTITTPGGMTNCTYITSARVMNCF